MKSDAPKRKIFSDAVDLLAGDSPVGAAAGNGIEMLDIDCIRPFHNHPFHLYEGERLDDMVESIKEHGILTPVIVRKMHMDMRCFPVTTDRMRVSWLGLSKYRQS